MIEYTFYNNGTWITVNANSVPLALELVRERKSAKFARECMLTNSKPTTAACVARLVS
jgi:hypothetical protein